MVFCPRSSHRILPLVPLLIVVVWAWSSGVGADKGSDESRTFRIVCFDDTLTGYRTGECYLMDYVKYSDLLGLMLEARIGIGNVNVFNSGWAGDSTRPKPNENWSGARGRVQRDIIDNNPDIAIILIGGVNQADTDEKRAHLKEDVGRRSNLKRGVTHLYP